MEDFVDISPQSDPIPQRIQGRPIRIVDRRNAILALEPRNDVRQDPSAAGTLLAHMLRDGMYRVEIVRMDVTGTTIERAGDCE